jgi:endonuclease/exonuclease/phosphatase family metal-dependent hydrolase
MKLISLNIWIKLDNANDVIMFLHEQNADIVCLQEVSSTPWWTHSMYNKKEYIDQELWILYPYRYRWPLFSTSYLWTSARDVWWIMEQWNYLLSRYPILEWKNEFYHKEYSYITDWSDWRENDHGRALTSAKINTPHWDVFIANVHGCRTSDKLWTERTKKQIDFLIKTCAKYEQVILVWDFNLLPETEEIQLLDSLYTNAGKKYWITSTRPDFDDWLDKWNQLVDYIFVSPQISLINFEVINTNISDHLPLLLEI